MASLRPAQRLLSRKLTHLTPSSSTLRPTTRKQLPTLHLTPSCTTTSRLFHTSPRQYEPPNTKEAYPNGSPGEPKPSESLSSGIAPSTLYSFSDIQSLSSSPTPERMLIDVREPSELLKGRIPTAVNVPVGSAPDAFFMNAEDFEDKYGFARPGDDVEVVFYCKAGVRSKAAARLAQQAGFGGKVGEFPGSWIEWVEKGGKVERE